MTTILWCPDQLVMEQVGAMNLDGDSSGPLVLIERDDDAMTPQQHVAALVSAIVDEEDQGSPPAGPTVLVGPEAFGWACVGMLRDLRVWLEGHEYDPVIVYVGPGETQLGRQGVEGVVRPTATTPSVHHGPSMMAPEAVLRVGALGAVNLADSVGRDWLERYTRGQVAKHHEWRRSESPRPVVDELPPQQRVAEVTSLLDLGAGAADVQRILEEGEPDA